MSLVYSKKSLLAISENLTKKHAYFWRVFTKIYSFFAKNKPQRRINKGVPIKRRKTDIQMKVIVTKGEECYNLSKAYFLKFWPEHSHIVYVNGSYKGNDPIGRLMHDFNCKKSKDMYHKELADGVKHFKEEGGRNMVCDAVEEYAEKKAKEAAKEAAKKAAKKAAIKSTIEDAVSYGMSKEQILKRVTEKYGLNNNEAEKLYNTYAIAAVQ